MTKEVFATVVNTGGTMSMAPLLVVLAPLVTTTRKTSPFIPEVTPEMLRVGTNVSVEGYQHKTDAEEMRAERITVDGKTVELR